MPFTMVRIDDRYIHGQVAVSWMVAIPAHVIYVVNDGVANDKMTCMVLEMAASMHSQKLEILGIEEGIKKLIEVSEYNENMWALFGNPQDVLTALKRGFIINRIILGFMHHTGNKKPIVKGAYVYVDDDDINTFREIHASGVEIVYQRVPEERPIDITKILDKP